jgi:hypothetical protein
MKENRYLKDCPEKADITQRSSWLEETFELQTRTGIQWNIGAQVVLVSVLENQTYDVVANQNPNHLFSNQSTLVPFSIYASYATSASMTIVIPDIHGNRRRVLYQNTSRQSFPPSSFSFCESSYQSLWSLSTQTASTKELSL